MRQPARSARNRVLIVHFVAPRIEVVAPPDYYFSQLSCLAQLSRLRRAASGTGKSISSDWHFAVGYLGARP
jgi:hypothetical protein